MNAKKGFFLTILALVILAFMLVSISWWATYVSEQESRSSERFRAEAVKSVLSQISDDEVSRFANISGYFALSKIAEYTAFNNTPLPQAPSADLANPETGNVNATMYDLVNNGTSRAGGPFLPYPITYSDQEKIFTFSSWAQSLSGAVEAVGYRLNVSPMRNFEASQVSPWKVRVRFTVDFNLSNEDGSIRMSRTVHADSNFTIDGLLDPMIYRGDVALQRPEPIPVPQRQIYYIPDYPDRISLQPVSLADGVEGKGWFYGPVTDFYPEKFNITMNLSKIKAYILMTTYDDLERESIRSGISVVSIAESYGGVLLTNKPNETISFAGDYGGCEALRVSQGKCFDCAVHYEAANHSDPDYPACLSSFPSQTFDPATIVDIPYIVVDGTSSGPSGSDWFLSIPPVDDGNHIERHLLFQSHATQEQYQYKRDGDKKIYNIEALRDMSVCGFYVQSPVGPSYFQRLVDRAPTLNSSSYGIETFVVGRWAGGDLGYDPISESQRSRVDRLFYSGISGEKVRGMMGCKSREMCLSVEAIIGVNDGGALGHFSIDTESEAAYNVTEIMCDSANCDVPLP